MGIKTSNNPSQDPQQGDHKQDTAIPLRKTANIPDVVYSRCGNTSSDNAASLLQFKSKYEPGKSKHTAWIYVTHSVTVWFPIQ